MPGFMDRLTGRKGPAPFDPGGWTVFRRDSGYGPLTVLVTETYKRTGPDPQRPSHVFLRLYIREPNENGMPYGRELQAVEALTDRTDLASNSCSAILVGRTTGNARREFHFYTPAAEPLMSALRTEMARYPNYQYDLTENQDPGWAAYQTLLPTPREQRETADRQVLDELAKHGDQAHLPRKVDHFADFRTAEGSLAFQQAVLAQGFAIENASQERDERGAPVWKLHVTRFDHVELSHIVQITEWLVATAEYYGGEYEGWGCPVTTP